MKLKDQVCSLKLAKKLKKLGVKQKSHFYWQYDHVYRNWEVWGLSDYENFSPSDEDIDKKISAFTVAELGELLPMTVISRRTEHLDSKTMFACELMDWAKPEGKQLIKLIYADTEANARAKVLIYLLENKLISLKNEN